MSEENLLEKWIASLASSANISEYILIVVVFIVLSFGLVTVAIYRSLRRMKAVAREEEVFKSKLLKSRQVHLRQLEQDRAIPENTPYEDLVKKLQAVEERAIQAEQELEKLKKSKNK